MPAVDERAGAVALHSAKYRRAGHLQLTAFFDDGAVERLALPLIVFTEMDAQHLGVTLQLHRWPPGLSGGTPRAYLMISTSEKATRPCWIISSRKGIRARSFSSLSTTESNIGRSCVSESARSS